MAVKKRALTVESWCEFMRKERSYIKKLGISEYIRLHEKEGHRIVDVIYELQMARAWELAGKQVYNFDSDFANCILSEKWVELLPDCIQYRPHDCFFMKLPNCKLNEGTLVYIVPTTQVVNFEEKWFPGCESKGVHYGGLPGEEIRAVVNTGTELLSLCAFAISATPELMLDNTVIEKYPVDLVTNGVAYLCSTNADIVPSYKPKAELKPNKGKKRSYATWYDVGYKIGADLRSYQRIKRENNENQGGSLRPHMRRAHWHHYWVGPKSGDRKLILKWIQSTLIGSTKIKDATLHNI